MACNSAIPEGFICAECHLQFYSVEQLLSHYDSHSRNKISQFQMTLLNKSSSNGQQSNQQQQAQANNVVTLHRHQSRGKTRSYFEDYKKYRKAKIDRFSSEANKLLIRLCKILQDLPFDVKLRRAHEQKFVAWIDEKIVQRCPDCSKEFGLRLRKHHCRLCGSVLCQNCSYFINKEQATQLIIGLDHFDNIHEDLSIRICSYCHYLTISRAKSNQFSANSNSKPILCQFYDKIEAQKVKALDQMETLENIAESMNKGETLFSMQHLSDQRVEFMKATEIIDNLSKKITVLGTNSQEQPNMQNPSLQKLQISIRNASTEFIKKTTLRMPIVLHDDPINSSAAGFEVKATKEIFPNDPFQQQMLNLKTFIDQAKKAGKTDEVEMLTKSLKELESMIK